MIHWQKIVRAVGLLSATAFPVMAAQTSVASAIASQAGNSTAFQPPAAESAATPPIDLEDALHAMFRSADTVFTGEVLDIRRAEDAVVVTWRVEDAVRGAQQGGTVALREWPGLWGADGGRYVVGEYALVMLHAPSVAGYASPVAGGDGIIPLHGNAPNGVLDLRHVAQHAIVTDDARLRPMRSLRSAGGSFAVSDAMQARAAARPGRTSSVPPLTPTDDGATAIGRGTVTAANNSDIDGTMVLGMLHAWQRAMDAGQ